MPWDEWIRLLVENWPLLARTLVQLVILVGIVYFLYNRFIRRSHAEQLIKGLFITLLLFVGLWGLARALNFPMLEIVFGASIQLLIIGLIVIFQPELRRMLLFLGQPELFGRPIFRGAAEQGETADAYLVHELVETVRFLSKSKTGALLVLESPGSPGGNYLEVGTRLDAELSTELLLTIFHPNTPLHDGAVIIDATHRVSAAGVLLPLTEDPKLSWQYGTRHRAALGLAEVSDSLCIVVSEETGGISCVHQGVLEKMTGADDLKKRLERIYHVSPQREGGRIPMGERFSDLLATELLPQGLQQIFNRRVEPPAGQNAPLRKPGSGL